MSSSVGQRALSPPSLAWARVLCYALGPAGALYLLKFSSYRHIWSIRMHSCHSLLMSGLFLVGWLVLSLAEGALPWFTSVLVREIRICAMLGAIPVWLLASIAAFRDDRFVAIPLLHEMAVRLARHAEHQEELR